VSPTSRAALLAGVLAVAALVAPLWIVVLAELALATAVVVDALAVRRAPDVERRVPPFASRGVPAPLHVAVAPRPGQVRVRQPMPPDVRLDPREADAELEAKLTARRRGRHVLPAVAVRTTGPLGLGRWDHRACGEHELLVYPDLPAARRLATAVRRGRFRLEGRARGPLGLGTEFESIRDYLPDDDVRQVNWRATQRLGRPMSNQYRLERDRDVICLVDCGRLMAAPLGDRTRLDAALDATVAVSAVADVLGDRCGTIAFDSTVRRAVPPRRRGANAVVRAVFDLEPVSVDSDYERAFVAVGEAKRAFVLVLTDLLEETAARPLIEAVPMLARRHVLAVASATDTDLERLTTEQPEYAIDVYRAAVALDVRAARERAARSLAHAGAEIVEAPPQSLGAACVRAYLRAKSRALV
jgi:uncharacterized protein (DUF58 family)